MVKQPVIVELQAVGDGGFGACKLITHSGYNSGLPVVQKINIDNSPENLRRFNRERAIQASLASETNFLEIYSPVLRTGSQRYYLMELADGGTVKQYIERNQNLSPDERLDIIEGMCVGLEKAHEHGYAHRDFHFKNVLLKLNGGSPVPVIVDFGRARDFSKPTISRGDQVLMLPYIFSPEAMFRIGLDDEQRKYVLADIYALGLMIHGIMTGLFYNPSYVLDLFQSVNSYMVSNKVAMANAQYVPLLSNRIKHVTRERHYFEWLANNNVDVRTSLRVAIASRSTDFNTAINELVMNTITLDYRTRYNSVTEVLQRIRDARSR